MNIGRRLRVALAKHIWLPSFRKSRYSEEAEHLSTSSRSLHPGKYPRLCTRYDHARSAIHPLLQTMISSEHGTQLVLRRLFSVKTALVLTWIVAILWGERWSFQRSLQECEWPGWEKWASIPDTNAGTVLMKSAACRSQSAPCCAYC